jgi:hypothetical protein
MAVPWEQVWGELQDALKGQPPCPIHKKYPHILTLNKSSINDVLEVGENEVCVRSHKPKGTDQDKDNRRRIDVNVFRKWWELLRRGAVPFTKGFPTPNSSVVAAILVRCLPGRIAQTGNGRTIELIP